jgi:peptidylprolyl isomerase
MTMMLAGALGGVQAAGPEDMLYLDLKDGRVVIEMRPDLAPKHVARIKQLVRQGFYNGLAFHRVIPNFVAQTGDPRGDGTGGSGVKLPPEFSKEPHVRGAVAMARSRALDSADSQFYIVLSQRPLAHLDNNYTVWGKVVKGMEFVDKIKQGAANRNGTVINPDRIVKMQVMADAKD